MKNCPKCNVEHDKPGRFCCISHANSRGAEYITYKKILKECLICGNNHYNDKYCSIYCSNSARRSLIKRHPKQLIQKICPTCDIEHYKSGIYCSRACGCKRALTDEQRIKMSQRSKESNAKYWTPENKKKHSELMKRVVYENPTSYSTNNVSGRVKNIEYNGSTVKGSWELVVAQVLDRYNITWTNEISGYKYFWNDTNHLYFPDFYLPEYNVFIEVKGYQRERDLCKWRDFPYDLIVLKEKEINELKTFIN